MSCRARCCAAFYLTMHSLLGIAHSGALIALIAHGMIGISLVWDKVLLKNPGTKNLYSYVFWLGALSVFGVILIPFGYKSISFRLIGIAFAAGVLDLAASYFYYAALKQGEASDTLAMMGGFSPLATALLALALLSKQMTNTQLWGFVAHIYGNAIIHTLSQYYKPLLYTLIALAVLGGLGALFYFKWYRPRHQHQHA